MSVGCCRLRRLQKEVLAEVLLQTFAHGWLQLYLFSTLSLILLFLLFNKLQPRIRHLIILLLS